MTSDSSVTAVTRSFEDRLKRWVTECLQNMEVIEEFQWLPLTGDAGFRFYFRISLPNTSLIAVYSPPETENNQAFCDIDRFFFQQGIHVPKILAYLEAEGFFLLEDLGEKMYLDHLSDETASSLYGEAFFALLRIQQCPLDESILPRYDRDFLLSEMQLFCQWFVAELLGYDINDEEQQLIERTFCVILDSALEQPQVVVHRDYHSRNIVYGVAGSPGIIDFQGALIGPLTYDVVSLLRDCYIEWPDQQVRSWALAYASLSVDAGIMESVSEERYLRWFDLMGLQRHIKVLGIFARLSIRDDKQAYLKDLPLVIAYVRRIARLYSETSPFADWFDAVLLPCIHSQPWMHN
ncbi:aminoglycoside phosphotransferase family protein [Agarilytica rhodophyticola]|uniref:aminoglycoside phosphotransferase family protein n=1 Tax=Agarilytica rhodophyticola TaxID=1737490 RepID=UPI000B3478E8|nr:phosphotransferase [Agarilytica rhodophyticola]